MIYDQSQNEFAVRAAVDAVETFFIDTAQFSLEDVLEVVDKQLIEVWNIFDEGVRQMIKTTAYQRVITQ